MSQPGGVLQQYPLIRREGLLPQPVSLAAVATLELKTESADHL